jgi:proteasome lid subunit RPN8/RPN11
MNKGSKAFTEYDFSDKALIDYRMDNLESHDWKIGHIHSHNTMRVFFSGTDMSELIDNSEFHNYYVSLIVNNFMETTAKVAFRGEPISSTYLCKNEDGSD